MSYDDLVAQVARHTGLSHERIKAVLESLPEALVLMRPGERIRTPLGVFTMVTTKNREVTMPDGHRTAKVASHKVVKLRPGARLRKIVI